jgi:hypothetical protein
MWQRARGLVVAPREELPKTLAESGALKDVLVPYVLVLAAIGPLAGFLSQGLIGAYQAPTKVLTMTLPAMWVRAPGLALGLAIIRYGIGIGSFVLFARVLDLLAPRFGGKPDRGGAYKTASCASTPVWIAAALSLLGSIPLGSTLAPIGVLVAVVYAVLIGSWAAPQNLSVPEPKALGLVLASVGIVVVATALAYWLIILALVSPLLLS